MPKYLALTMRMMQTEYEQRDAIARDWWSFLHSVASDLLILPVPNIGQKVIPFLNSFDLMGIIFSGGDDWGKFPERDLTENLIFQYVLNHETKNNLPLLGICRGAQIINRFYYGQIVAVTNHVATRHQIDFKGQNLEVNSYHNFGILAENLGQGLMPLAKASDASIEAFTAIDSQRKIAGLMWHPERETRPAEHDLQFFREFFSIN